MSKALAPYGFALALVLTPLSLAACGGNRSTTSVAHDASGGDGATAVASDPDASIDELASTSAEAAPDPFADPRDALAESSGAPSDGPSDAVADADTADTRTELPPVGMAMPCGVIEPTGKVLLNLGHGSGVTRMRQSGDRILSQDFLGRWTLFDRFTRTQVASGDAGLCPVGLSGGACLGGPPGPSFGYLAVDMAGSIVAIPSATSIALLSAVDGTLRQTVVVPPFSFYGLSSDGGYIWTVGASGIGAWSVSGAALFNRAGDYSQANVFAAPTETRILSGPAGNRLIEYFSVPSGARTLGTYVGAFASWFVDGSRFIAVDTTILASTVRVYSSSGALQSTQTLPTSFTIVGQGNYLWTLDSYHLDVYPLGANAVAASVPASPGWSTVVSADMIGIMDYPIGHLHLLDLSGSTVAESDVALPVNSPRGFAADSSGNWSVGDLKGVVYDKNSLALPGGPQPFNCGAVLGIAGAESGRVAIATGSGQTLIVDQQPTGRTLKGAFAMAGANVQISTSGSVLAEATSQDDLGLFDLDRGVNTKRWSYGGSSHVVGFSLSRGATRVGLVTTTFTAAGTNSVRHYEASITDLLGTPIDLNQSFTLRGPHAPLHAPLQPITFSPDGTLYAVYDYATAAPGLVAKTNIFRAGTSVGSVDNEAVGWIDNARLLVRTYGVSGTGGYTGSTIYDSQGNALSFLPIPRLSKFTSIGTTQIYAPDTNTIYDLADGHATWTSPDSSGGQGDVAGKQVIFAAGRHVLVEPY